MKIRCMFWKLRLSFMISGSKSVWKNTDALMEDAGSRRSAAAREMLTALGFQERVIRRVEYLVGHHHTYKDIDGLDYQILVEADFLVNYFEDGLDKEHIKKSAEKIFKTETGKKISKRHVFPGDFSEIRNLGTGCPSGFGRFY